MRHLLAVLAVVATACSPGARVAPTTDTVAPNPTTAVPAAPPSTTTFPTVTTTTVPAPTVSTPETSTPAVFAYAVVAEERARRLAVVDPAEPTGVVMSVELPLRPHNLTGFGPVVYATHPDSGAISRVDLSTGEVITASVGVEPHDVKMGADVLYVADEDGGALLVVDPTSLAVRRIIPMPGRPHDLYLADGIWVTLVGLDRLARVTGDRVAEVGTGGSPHDLVVDDRGRVWFSNWGSAGLDVYDPSSDSTAPAPAGVVEPHHFASGPDGTVWVSDNGGSSVVGFTDVGTVSVEVGSTPHHLAFVGDLMVVAVSGSGEAVLVGEGTVRARIPLSRGLHGVAVVELPGPIGP